jgi:hypothetical protein
VGTAGVRDAHCPTIPAHIRGRITGIEPQSGQGADTEYQYTPAGETAGLPTPPQIDVIKKVNDNPTVLARKRYVYDDIGRAGTITAADGKVTRLEHTGVSKLVRKVMIGTAIQADAKTEPDEPVPVVETEVATTEYYDRQGRLYRIVEPADYERG